MSAPLPVQAGDWFVVATGNQWIYEGESLVQRLARRTIGKGRWTHAGVAGRWVSSSHPGASADLIPADAYDTLMIVEATPQGAVEVPWHWEHHNHLWSTGIGLSNMGMTVAASKYIGVGYSFLDYAAIGTHALHIPAPGLRGFIESTKHMICSQLVDRCAQDAGVKLFDDERWNGYVTPMDLGELLEAEEHLAWMRSMKGKGLQWPSPPG